MAAAVPPNKTHTQNICLGTWTLSARRQKPIIGNSVFLCCLKYVVFFPVLAGFGVQQCSLEMRWRQQRHDGIVCSSMETTVITYLFVMRMFAVLPSTIRLHFTIRTACFLLLLLLHIFNIYYFCYHWRAAAARDECVRSMSIVELRHFHEPKKKPLLFTAEARQCQRRNGWSKKVVFIKMK